MTTLYHAGPMTSFHLAGVNVSYWPTHNGMHFTFHVLHGNCDECGRDTGRTTDFLKSFDTEAEGLAWVNEYIESNTP